jgi:hypothetical protein
MIRITRSENLRSPSAGDAKVNEGGHRRGRKVVKLAEIDDGSVILYSQSIRQR